MLRKAKAVVAIEDQNDPTCWKIAIPSFDRRGITEQTTEQILKKWRSARQHPYLPNARMIWNNQFSKLFSGVSLARFVYSLLAYRIDLPSQHWVWTTLGIRNLMPFFRTGRLIEDLRMTRDNQFSILILGPLIRTFCIHFATLQDRFAIPALGLDHPWHPEFDALFSIWQAN